MIKMQRKLKTKSMLLTWIGLCLWAMPVLTGTGRKCPTECTCSIDEQNLYQAVCTKGGLTAFPTNQLDTDVRIIIIRGPRNTITIGPLLRQFTKLEVLRITDSNLPAIGNESIWGLKYLRILDLSKNNITNIKENNFRGQDNLIELDLSKNKILRMASSTFRHLRELRRLNLADNSIVELTQRNFFMLNNLKYLDLSGNPLQDLQPDVFRDVPELRIFKCRNCQLKKINPQLYNLLPMLTELDLGRNEFKFLDKDEFRDVKRLTKVLLDGNQLSVVVDELFRMQKSLNHLDLSYNRLAKVPNDSFLHLGNLTFLDLSYNKLVRLEPQSVRRLGNLRTLNISGNTQMDLHEMRETFELIPQLTHLSIADMGILPMGLLVPFKQLRYLNISGNHLDNMSLQVIDPCRELEFLDLSRNQLYGINEDTALRIQGIRNVRLDNNPLICDECHMGKLINVVRHLQWKWDAYPICFLPKSLRGAEITDLDVAVLDTCLEYITDEEQNAASTSHNFLERGGLNTLAILGGIIFVLIAIIILAMFVCFSKHRARYYTREDRINSSEGKCLEKNLEASANNANGNGNNANTSNNGSGGIGNGNNKGNREATGGNEINFKFPIDDRVCTIDEFVLPPVPPPPAHEPPKAMINNSGNIMYSATPVNGINGNVTAIAAVAAAATVIPPGVPSATTTLTPTRIVPTKTMGTATAAAAAAVNARATTTLPQETVVVVLQSPPPSMPLSLPPPPTATAIVNAAAASSSTTMTGSAIAGNVGQQPEQQLLHLTTLEPLVSVN